MDILVGITPQKFFYSKRDSIEMTRAFSCARDRASGPQADAMEAPAGEGVNA